MLHSFFLGAESGELLLYPPLHLFFLLHQQTQTNNQEQAGLTSGFGGSRSHGERRRMRRWDRIFCNCWGLSWLAKTGRGAASSTSQIQASSAAGLSCSNCG